MKLSERISCQLGTLALKKVPSESQHSKIAYSTYSNTRMHAQREGCSNALLWALRCLTKDVAFRGVVIKVPGAIGKRSTQPAIASKTQ